MENKYFNLDVTKYLPKIKDGHYFLGSGLLGSQESNSNGDWSAFIPTTTDDFQSNKGIDAMDCTVYGTDHALITLMKSVFGQEYRYAQRYIAILTGITQQGGDPHMVAEMIRLNGEIPYSDLPFDDSIASWNDYYSPKPMSFKLLSEGQNWLNQYSFGHEWVFDATETLAQKQAKITQALKRSPLGMSVSAWFPDGLGGYNQPANAPENHWVECYKEDVNYYYIFDSYDNTHKKYCKLSNISLCKLYKISAVPIQNYSAFYTYFGWVYNILKQVGLMKNQTETDITVSAFCLAIQEHEGWYPNSRSYRNNNPGNLKYSSVDSLISKHTSLPADPAGFAVFPNYQSGFLCLKEKITNACTGKSTVYFPTDTIEIFFQKYAPSYDNNDPDVYAKFVASALKVDIHFQIKNLIIS